MATMDEHNEVEDEDANAREEDNQEAEEEPVDDDAHDLLATAGLEDPDADDDVVMHCQLFWFTQTQLFDESRTLFSHCIWFLHRYLLQL